MHAYHFAGMKVMINLIFFKFMILLHKARLKRYRKLKTKEGRELLGCNQSIPSTGAQDNLLAPRHIK